jgi:D-alanyl-D-alanine dipeptidase
VFNLLQLCLSILFLFEKTNSNVPNCEMEIHFKKLGLLDIQTVNPRIKVELKYSSKDNFIGYDVYGCMTKAFLQKEAAEHLSKASDLLQIENPGFQLLVYDAARPSWAQKILWDSLKKPESSKHIYVANPKKGSIHNYGCAVDLTIVDKDGKPLDMGTTFDFFENLAQPRLEKKLLQKGLLSPVQYKNRLLLRKVMLKAGFSTTTSEWWHFNFGSLSQLKKKYHKIP